LRQTGQYVKIRYSLGAPLRRGFDNHCDQGFRSATASGRFAGDPRGDTCHRV